MTADTTEAPTAVPIQVQVSSPKPRTTTPKTADAKPRIPARQVGVLATNAAAGIVEAAVMFPVATAAAAAIGGVALAATTAHKTARARTAARTAGATAGRTPGSKTPAGRGGSKLGSAGSGATPSARRHSAAGLGLPTSRRTRANSSGNTPGSGAAGGRRANGHNPNGKNSGAGRPGGRTAAGRLGRALANASRSAGRQLTNPNSKVGRAAGKAANAAQRGTRNAWKTAPPKTGNGVKARANRALAATRLGKALRAAGWGLPAVARKAWKRWTRKPAASQDPTKPASVVDGGRTIGDTVQRPDHADGVQPAVDITPTTAEIEEVITAMSRALIDLSEQMVAMAARMSTDPERGMLTRVADIKALEQVMENMATVARHVAVAAPNHPWHPAIVATLDATNGAQRAVANVIGGIGGEIERLHWADIARLRNPRVNEQMWDVTHNQDAA